MKTLLAILLTATCSLGFCEETVESSLNQNPDSFIADSTPTRVDSPKKQAPIPMSPSATQPENTPPTPPAPAKKPQKGRPPM